MCRKRKGLCNKANHVIHTLESKKQYKDNHTTDHVTKTYAKP